MAGGTCDRCDKRVKVSRSTVELMADSKEIETATTAVVIEYVSRLLSLTPLNIYSAAVPDQKTRRYDRQLRYVCLSNSHSG